MHSQTIILALGLICAYAIYSLLKRQQEKKWLQKIPIHDFEGDKSWHRYQNDYRGLIRTGYNKYSRNGQMFRTKNTDGSWRIVISLEHLKEIKHASNKTLSWQRQIQDILLMTHTGAPDRPPWSGKVIRMELNKRLDNLTDYMISQINSSFTRLLPEDDGKFHEINILHLFRQAVAQITTRVFSSEELAEDQEWNNSVNRFTADGWGAAFAVREYNPWIRYIAAFFLPAVHRIQEDRAFARKKLGPLYSARLKAMEKGDAKDMPDDGMQWLIEATGGSMSLDALADTMIRIMMAAVHTTAQASTYALMHILTAQDDLLPTLREEVKTAINEASSASNLTDLLPKTASCIKESTRMAPLGVIMVGRKVIQTHVFNDGTQIPAGHSIFTPTEAVNHDEEIYPYPEQYDGLRFHRLREQGGASEYTKWMLGNAIEESTGFGYGAQACPGRWFAGREMVLMFSKLLGDYEVKWAPEHSAEPKAVYQERAQKAPTDFYMSVRKRKVEDRLFPQAADMIGTS